MPTRRLAVLVAALVVLLGTGPAIAALVSGTKTATGDGGPFEPGDTVTYTVVLTNNGVNSQGNNPGDEFTDVLPAALTLVSAVATSGIVVANVGTNTVTWNGPLPPGGSVTITIVATIKADTPTGTLVSNQGSIAFDSDATNDGTNDASAVTDDPVPSGSEDPTTFLVTVLVPPVPTLGTALFVVLALLLTSIGFVVLGRRRHGQAS
jgi:uncharacterized repeat protein (TIGR01451 family)